jgi:hypothetical protein
MEIIDFIFLGPKNILRVTATLSGSSLVPPSSIPIHFFIATRHGPTTTLVRSFLMEKRGIGSSLQINNHCPSPTEKFALDLEHGHGGR